MRHSAAVPAVFPDDFDDAGERERGAQILINRLEQALSGKTPADEQAVRLAQKQKDLAEKADKLAADPAAPKAKQDELKAQPIEDPENLDQRRAAVGLGPFAEYEALMHRRS